MTPDTTLAADALGEAGKWRPYSGRVHLGASLPLPRCIVFFLFLSCRERLSSFDDARGVANVYVRSLLQCQELCAVVGRQTSRVSIAARRLVAGSEERWMDLGLYMPHCGHPEQEMGREARWSCLASLRLGVIFLLVVGRSIFLKT